MSDHSHHEKPAEATSEKSSEKKGILRRVLGGIGRAFNWVTSPVRNKLHKIFPWLKEDDDHGNHGSHGAETKKEKKINFWNNEKETVTVNVLGACKSEGSYVGLTEELKTALNVKNGDTVAVLVGGDFNEYYTVGDITEEALKEADGNPNAITINDKNGKISSGMSILIRKKPEVIRTNLEVEYGIESKAPPARNKKISERFTNDAELEHDCYITVPNPFVHEIDKTPTAANDNAGRQGKNVAHIVKAKINYNGKLVPIIVVPSGHNIGLSQKAAEKLSIKDIDKLHIEIGKDGILNLSEAKKTSELNPTKTEKAKHEEAAHEKKKEDHKAEPPVAKVA